MRELKVLIFPSGTEMGMEIYKCLKASSKIKIFAGSSDVSNHTPYLYRKCFLIPDIEKPNCLEELNRAVRKEKIDYIYPANPIVIDFLNDNRNSIDCEVVLPPKETVEITRSKKKTYATFRDILPVPRVYSPDSVTEFPVFVKPDSSYGSQGGRLVNSRAELELIKNIQDYVICEYLPGREYSIDCFSSRDGGVVFCSGRVRRRVRMGTSMSAYLSPEYQQKLFMKYARLMQDKLHLQGGWFFQMKDNSSGELTLLEIEPRIAGTMALNRVRGINFPLMSIRDREHQSVEFILNNCDVELDRALVNRYQHDLHYDRVHVCLEDTLLVKGKVNIDLLKFIYQTLNEGKKVSLISRLKQQKGGQALEKWKLASIFDEVTWLEDGETKSSHISGGKSILIDEHFEDRKEVVAKLGIPTFDLSMLEMLIDERID